MSFGTPSSTSSYSSTSTPEVTAAESVQAAGDLGIEPEEEPEPEPTAGSYPMPVLTGGPPVHDTVAQERPEVHDG